MVEKQVADLTIEDIIERKKQARAERARMTFGQKVLIVERMREQLAPFNRLRQERKRSSESAE